MKKTLVAAIAATLLSGTASYAADLEVTHWWVSEGESAAVAEFARIFEEQTGNTWIDSALPGSGTGANPVIVSRIIGGNPMGATMMNTGRDAEELIQAGLMRDISDIAKEQGWYDFYVDTSLLAPCEYEGGLYCVPVNIHSWDWLWLSTKAYEKIGMDVPTNWEEYVASWPALADAGIIEFGLASGWPISGIPGVLQRGVGGTDLYYAINRDKSIDAVRSPEFRKVAQAMADIRDVLEQDELVPAFADVGNQLLTGEAAGNIHGDWLQGDLQVAGGVPGVDYECLPGLGQNPGIEGGGDAFYFPKLPEGTDPAVVKAQTDLAGLLAGKEAQLAFNMKKGSMPIRTDLDLSQANACMQKAIAILKTPGGLIQSGEALLSSDTQAQMQDLSLEFMADDSITVDDYIDRFAEIMEMAD